MGQGFAKASQGPVLDQDGPFNIHFKLYMYQLVSMILNKTGV